MGQLSSVNNSSSIATRVLLPVLTTSASRVSTGSSENIIPESVSVIQDEVVRQARVLQEIAVLTYEDFQLCLEQLNELCSTVTDINGKKLLFAVKKGTDSTVLWKGTVKIACIKIDPETKVIESHRLFNLTQFLKIFKTLECQLTAALQSSKKERMQSTSSSENPDNDSSDESSPKYSPKSSSVSSNNFNYDVSSNTSDNSSSSSSGDIQDEEVSASIKNDGNGKRPREIKLKDAQMKKFTASVLLEEVDNLANSITDKLGECSICLERKPDVMLPCTHSYCMPCIEQWNAWHKTCPFCRETLDNTDDTWVISDIPGFQEISDDICSALMDLTSPE